jgi:primosomal replication protein N
LIRNRLVLSGRIVELDALRRTPAGIPVLKFRISHESEQMEAGHKRQAECELDAVAFEADAALLAGASLGRGVTLTGFLARKSRNSRRPVLHVTDIEFAEGD